MVSVNRMAMSLPPTRRETSLFRAMLPRSSRGGQKSVVKGSLTLSGGTGKFTGLAGSGTFAADGFMFRPAENGTYFEHGTRQYSYKLP